MARINIEERVFREQGFQDLMIAVQSRHMAKGIVVELFQLAQEYWFPSRQLIPLSRFEAAGLPTILYAPGGLAELRDGAVYVRGSEDAFLWLFQKQAGGESRAKAAMRNKDGSFKKAQKQRVQQATSTAGELTSTSQHSISTHQDHPGSLLSSLSSSLSPLVHNSNSSSLVSSDGVQGPPSVEANRKVWLAYRDAYLKRYGEEPVRNAKVNTNIAGFVRRVGSEEAAAIAEFYVRHNDSFYVRNTHSFAFALRDAESLRTQWAKGKAITQADVRRFEKNQQTLSLIDSIDREGV